MYIYIVIFAKFIYLLHSYIHTFIRIDIFATYLWGWITWMIAWPAAARAGAQRHWRAARPRGSACACGNCAGSCDCTTLATSAVSVWLLQQRTSACRQNVVISPERQSWPCAELNTREDFHARAVALRSTNWVPAHVSQSSALGPQGKLRHVVNSCFLADWSRCLDFAMSNVAWLSGIPVIMRSVLRFSRNLQATV